MKRFAVCKHPDKRKTLLTRNWQAAVVFVLVCGCANPAGIDEKNHFSSAQDVVENLSRAYAQQNLQRYLESFSDDIEFREGVATLWGKEQEEHIHRKMFATAKAINLTLQELGTVQLTETNKTAVYSYRLQLHLLNGAVLKAAGDVQLEFRMREAGAWQIRAFREVSERLAKSTAGVVSPDDTLDYFPLRVGNSWTYEEQFAPNIPEVEVSVIDSILIEGNLYYQFDQDLIFSSLARMDSLHQLRFLFEEDSSERVVFNFTAEVGDSLTFTPPNATEETVVELLSRKDSVTVPAGTFKNVLEFSITDIGSAFSSGCEFAVNVGIIRQTGTNQVLALKRASVNGKRYPVITSVETSDASWTQIKSRFR
ncbi:MAG: nuclear transport factor 2 family protein [bacterium]